MDVPRRGPVLSIVDRCGSRSTRRRGRAGLGAVSRRRRRTYRPTTSRTRPSGRPSALAATRSAGWSDRPQVWADSGGASGAVAREPERRVRRRPPRHGHRRCDRRLPAGHHVPRGLRRRELAHPHQGTAPGHRDLVAIHFGTGTALEPWIREGAEKRGMSAWMSAADGAEGAARRGQAEASEDGGLGAVKRVSAPRTVDPRCVGPINSLFGLSFETVTALGGGHFAHRPCRDLVTAAALRPGT